MSSLCCIGHITRDKITSPQQTIYMSGGVAFYFSYAINCLPKSADYMLVTKIAAEDLKAVEDMSAAGVKVICHNSKTTVFFENIYGDNLDERTQRVWAKSDPFNLNDINNVYAGIYHLGTLLSDDFTIDFVKELRKRGKVSVDAQGFLRQVRGGQVEKCDWADKEQWLRYVDIIKVNEMEMEAITGTVDPHRAAKVIANYGPDEVLVTLGSAGSLILYGGEFFNIPAYPPEQVIDTTGCGDTYMAGYLYCRAQGALPKDSACFAAAMCSSKIAHNGPFAGNIDEIRKIGGKNIIL